MRICILSKHLPPQNTDGIARNRWTYARYYKQLGCEVHIITYGITGVEDYRDGIHIHEVNENDYDIKEQTINTLVDDESLRHSIAYSYAVYKRIEKLHATYPVDIIDAGLWGIEGLMSKLKLPAIPMLTRLDTTTRLINEINYPAHENEFTTLNKLEQFLLLHSDLYSFNSWSILKETERLYDVSFQNKQYDIIYHGIDVKPAIKLETTNKNIGRFKVLIPGRLEKRKGTRLMVKWVLAELIKNPQIEVHFAGKDHAAWDGFETETGVNYSKYINKKFSKYIGNQIFLHGYVDNMSMEMLFQDCDCVLIPSLYESFGLVYLEAANYKKPVIAFKAGAVPELFIDGEEILLADTEKPLEIVSLVNRLYSGAGLGEKLALKAHQKLLRKFTAVEMADKCLSFIRDYFDTTTKGLNYQVINALTEGDGVGRIVLDYDFLIKQQGLLTQIIGNHVSDSLSHLSDQIHKFNFTEQDTLIYHYCGHCEWAEYFNTLKAPAKILLFHNITPPHYFARQSNEYKSASNGYLQAPSLDGFDLYVALSEYSLNVLKQLIPKQINAMVIPQLIEPDLIYERPYDAGLHTILAGRKSLHIIFVGRVVPHKKQVDIINFARYYRDHFSEDLQVTIIGGGTAAYVKELNDLISKNKLTKHVTLTGKIPDEELYAYYRAADIFLSMSEHEGFGIPLAEAMVFNVPVVAYGVTAIPETVGDNGCLFFEKDFHSIGQLVNRLYNDVSFKSEVIRKQQMQLKNYSKESVQAALDKMNTICHQLHRKRIQHARQNDGFLQEQFINFKDPLIHKTGVWKIADGRTLIHYGQEQGALDIIMPAIEFEVFLVNNSHSGKVAIYFNQEEARIIDLYHAQWIVKGYTFISKNGYNAQRLKIVPLCESNALSTGKEVLVYGIRLKTKHQEPLPSLFDASVKLQGHHHFALTQNHF